ncbi:hypothetical protein AAGS61_04570 [Lysinibacillus sp. KU-BSD001]|uniref:HNH endonuclease n=1 Tax=Lysinibacillus sp. KU-BSD001 TaxID=3141328 RepID=UPI0036F04886
MIAIKSGNLKYLSKMHFEAIKIHLNHPRLKFKFEDINNWFLNNGKGRTFEEVILADFAQLKLIKEEYTNTQPSKITNYIKDVLFERYFSQSTVGLKGTKYNASKLIEGLDIIVCPYCNRNFINNIKYKNGQARRTSHIDHFFSKDKYPFLSMSFYNLIPCCPSCNHVKSNKIIGYSPYDNTIDSNLNYKFDYLINSIDFLTNLSAFEIRLISENSEFENNIEVLGLRELYGCHKDIVQEILKKKTIYTATKIEELYRDFNRLFSNKEEMINTIFGYYLNEDNFHKRPLSKLATDIYNN